MADRPPIPLVLRELGITCDAPPYAVVQASRQIELHNPEDVRWEFAPPGSLVAECCGGLLALPLKEYISGAERFLLRVAQCPRCYTIFWRAALVGEREAA